MTAVRIEHDGFEGDVIGSYVTREGKRGAVVQQTGTRVVHVYGEKWLGDYRPTSAADVAEVVEPYAYEFGRSNGDGTFSVVIERGEPKRPHSDWPVKPLYSADRLAAMSHRVGELTRERDEAKHLRDHYLDASEAWKSRAVGGERRAEAAEAKLAERDKEIEQLTPLAVAYDYLESPVGREIAEEKLAAAEAKLAEAVAALEPFAAYIKSRDLDDADIPDPTSVISYATSLRGTVVAVTFGDLRRARSIASTISTKGDGQFAADRQMLFEAASDPSLSDGAVRSLCLARASVIDAETRAWAETELSTKGDAG